MAETFTNASVKLATTSATDIYQAPTGDPADRAILLSCLVANVSGIVTDITITITDATDAVLSTLAQEIPMPTQASLEVVVNKVILKQSQKIRATASASNQLEVTLSALEITV
jgi:ACT domain-containing protein